MKDVKPQNRRLTFYLIAALLVALGGCMPGSTTSTAPIDEVGADLAPVASAVANFDDIEIPAEMKNDAPKSMSIATDSFRGGILHYAGRVEATSLKDFIR